jgi:hypothetical protein
MVGALHTITNIRPDGNENPKAYPAFKYNSFIFCFITPIISTNKIRVKGWCLILVCGLRASKVRKRVFF